jgi:hypothetical protein
VKPVLVPDRIPAATDRPVQRQPGRPRRTCYLVGSGRPQRTDRSDRHALLLTGEEPRAAPIGGCGAGVRPHSSGARGGFAGTRAGRDRVSRGPDLKQPDNDSLLGPGRCRARAAAPGCPVSEAGCGRAAVAGEARIGTGRAGGPRQQPSIGSGQPGAVASHRPPRCAGISARLDEIGNNIPLACRVQLAEPGAPVTAACSGSAPRRFLARMPAPRLIRSRATSGS